MKTRRYFCLFFLVLSFSKVALAQSKCIVKRIGYDAGKETSQIVQEKFFNEKGQIVRCVDFLDGHVVSDVVSEYSDTLVYRVTKNEAGRKAVCYYFYSAGSLVETFEILEEGVMYRRSVMVDSLAFVSLTIFSEYRMGILKQINRETKLFDSTWNIKASYLISNSDTLNIFRYNYSASGLLEKEFGIGSTGEINSEQEFEYDSKKNLTSKLSYENGSFYLREDFTYDKENRIVSVFTLNPKGDTLNSEFRSYGINGETKVVNIDHKFEKKAIRGFRNERPLYEEYFEGTRKVSRIEYLYKK